MTALLAVAVWLVASFPVAVLFGRWIAAGDPPTSAGTSSTGEWSSQRDQK